MRRKILNSLLVEIMMAMLFFALSATVILQVFLTAHNQSSEAVLLSNVLLEAQNLADESYLSAEVAEAVIEHEGFSLRLSVEEEKTAAGVLRRAVITATDADGNAVLALPSTRYIADEEAAR